MELVKGSTLETGRDQGPGPPLDRSSNCGTIQVPGQGGLKLLTWNINGLRSLNNFSDWLRLDADILCFQETKVTRDMLSQTLAVVPGYTSYYAFSRTRGGYSGVATYVRVSSTPVAAEEGITGLLSKPDSAVGGTDLLHVEFTQEELRSLDGEGRCVITKHKLKSNGEREEYMVLMNVYCPRADPEREDRKKFKLLFYKALDVRAHSLRAQGHKVIVVGDINTSHRELDHCDPYEEFHDHPGRRFLNHFLQSTHSVSEEENKRRNGKEEERQLEYWECERVEVEERQFLDSFRLFHSDREMAFTCWNIKMNCRSTNYGTRIDYIFISRDLRGFISSCDIQPEVEGSDHCPVSATFSFALDPASKPPPSATKYYPEFQGKQLSIKDLFSKSGKREPSPDGTVLSQPIAKRSKPGNTKITNFFAPKKQDKTEDIYDAGVDTAIDAGYNGCYSEQMCATNENSVPRNGDSKAAWGKLFKPPPPAPLCLKHQEECLKRKVTKKGPNQGREFYVCRRGEGRADDPNARCDFFKWAKLK